MEWSLLPSLALGASVLTLGLPAPATASTRPDPLRSDQWALGAIGAPQAWAKSAGDGVVFAVVDTGVQISHPDLAGNVWTNPDETVNGRDDDGNGIVDDVHGANVVDHTGDVSDD